MKPLVYLAGPYSHPDPIVNTRATCLQATTLHNTGVVTPIVPHLTMVWHMVDPHDIDYWYAYDMDVLAHCQALLRLPGESTGADAEVEFAISHDIPVFYDRDSLMRWVWGH